MTASVADSLPSDLAHDLFNWRRRNVEEANVDESELRPAVERYDGHFYAAGRSAIGVLLDRGARVLIISGGYGLVVPDESIGMYICVFQPNMWPDRLIERCLAAYADETGVTQVVGVLSATTNYARVFRGAAWPSTVESVHLLTPEPVSGAMVRAPRAQGQALAIISETGSLADDWVSTDGLVMEVEPIDVH